MPTTPSSHEVEAEATSGKENEIKMKPLSPDINSTGLAALPAEVVLEIIQHIPGFDRLPDYCHGILSKEYVHRSESLLALSQTCQWLRETVGPFIWRRVEVCASSLYQEHPGWVSSDYARNGAWHTELATNLLRQIEIVTIRDIIRAQQVREVCVALSIHSAAKVYGEFARFLACLPNLHTLHILYVPYQCEEPFRKAFFKTGVSYPTVCSATLHPRARHILPYLSGVISLHFVGDLDPLSMWRVDPSYVVTVRDIVNNANPGLRVLDLGRPLFCSTSYIHEIDFSKFTQLVEYPIRVPMFHNSDLSELPAEVIAHAKTFESLRVIHINMMGSYAWETTSMSALCRKFTDRPHRVSDRDEDAKELKIWYSDRQSEDFTPCYGNRYQNVSVYI